MGGKTRMLALAALFAVVTAAANFIKIPVGVVPITLLYFATALSGALLGPKWGAVSQGVYVALGLVGLPIFTGGGGLGYVLQPSFGFLLGLVPAAWTVGMLSRGEPGRPAFFCPPAPPRRLPLLPGQPAAAKPGPSPRRQ